MLNARLRIFEFALGQGFPGTVRTAHEEFQQGGFTAHPCPLDAVEMFLILKIEHHLSAVALIIDNSIIFGTRLAEERPSQCIKQGGFASTVMPADAGQIKSGEIHLLRLPIGKETL